MKKPSKNWMKGLILVLSATLLAGCGTNNGGNSSEAPIDSNPVSSEPAPSSSETSKEEKTSVIDLKSAKEQTLKVGEEMTLVYLLKDNTKDVSFSSSDKSVVTVDDYGNVSAKGEGEATVTISVIGDESDKVEVHFTVKKSFFIYQKGLYNGTVDYSREDEGIVKAKEGQVQMLVNECSETWYFKAHIERKGSANGDTGGRWGIGSFWVDNDHPIGNNMFWCGFRRPNGANDMDVTPYYGGWRYEKNMQSKEIDINPQITFDATGGVDVTILRKGKMHYFAWDTGTEEYGIVKTAVALPYFEGHNTYPGVYSQNQILDVTNFEASSDPTVVSEKLDEFQKAESVKINVIDNRLINGKAYQLSSTVLPASTPNKDVTYTLDTKNSVSGVSLTEDGLLTVEDNVTGAIYVDAVAKNNPNAKNSARFNIINAPAATEGYINGEMVVKANTKTTFTTNSLNVSSGANYFPLNAKDENWAVSLKVKNTSSALKKGNIGVMSAIDGYMDYFQNAFAYSDTIDRNMVGLRLNDDSYNLAYARNGVDVLNVENELSVIKFGAKQYVAVNGKLLGVYDALEEATTPVIFTDNVKGEVTVDSVVTGEAATKAKLDSYDFFVGGNVEKNGTTYSLAQKDFAGNDMNWPPVNGFANGLKNKENISGDFDVSFMMSNLAPMGDSFDSKVLIYLNTLDTSNSIQLVIKGNAGHPTYALCPNYDDATWDEFDLSGYNINFAQPVFVKVEKREAGCKVFFNGTEVLAGSTALKNDNYDWSATSPMLPGIGTFKCGATIATPSIRKI